MYLDLNEKIEYNKYPPLTPLFVNKQQFIKVRIEKYAKIFFE